MKKIEVVAAIIYFGNKILCVQRPKSKLPYISEKFEFPGGKIEDGESKQDALKRELFEELDITPTIKSLFLKVVHQYPDFELTMHSYICEVDTDELTLKEHVAMKWLTLQEIDKLDWAAADLQIVNQFLNMES